MEINVTLSNGSVEPGFLDPGSQIVIIHKVPVQELNMRSMLGSTPDYG